MSLTVKKVSDFIGDALLGAIVLSLLYLVSKPIFESGDYYLRTLGAMSSAYDNKDKTLAEFERLSYRNNGVVFMALDAEYRIQALKSSGIDMEIPQESFDSVDLTKSDALLLRAIDQLSDVELLMVLKAKEIRFDEAKAEDRRKNPGKCDKSPVRCSNYVNFDQFSKLDQDTKARLRACKIKLQEKLPNRLMSIVNMNSYGTCTETAPGTLGSIIKSKLLPE